MFDCCCSYDGEKADIYSEKYVLGRKDHCCCECGDIIKKGTRHRHVKMLFEGDWSNDRVCSRCEQIRKDHGDCMPLGCLKDELIGCGWEPELLGF